MNHRILIVAVLSLTAIIGSIQKAGAAVAYTNTLTDGSLVSSNFTSYTTVDSDYINNPSGGWFIVDPNYGLELLSTNPNYVEGLATYNRLLQASNDWTITIQPHISAFTNSQTNPYYAVGLCLIKTSTNGLEYPNRLELNLCRTGVDGGKLSNSIASSMFVNNGETLVAANQNLTNVYLQFKYTAATKSVISSYSTNGLNFTPIRINSLTREWGIKNTDVLTLGLAANNQPDGRVIPSYSILPGQMYLNNLTISSPNASSIAPPNNTTGGTLGGTLTLGTGGSQNTYSGGLTINNGGVTFSGGTGTLSLGGGSLSNGNLQVTNPNIGSSSNSNSHTNILGGGTSTLTITNTGGTPPNTGSMTNANTLPGGIAGAGGIIAPPAMGSGSITVGAGGVIFAH